MRFHGHRASRNKNLRFSCLGVPTWLDVLPNAAARSKMGRLVLKHIYKGLPWRSGYFL